MFVFVKGIGANAIDIFWLAPADTDEVLDS